MLLCFNFSSKAAGGRRHHHRRKGRVPSTDAFSGSRGGGEEAAGSYCDHVDNCKGGVDSSLSCEGGEAKEEQQQAVRSEEEIELEFSRLKSALLRKRRQEVGMDVILFFPFKQIKLRP